MIGQMAMSIRSGGMPLMASPAACCGWGYWGLLASLNRQSALQRAALARAAMFLRTDSDLEMIRWTRAQ